MDERNEDYDIYGSFACVYDKFMDNVPYKEWGKYLKSLLEEQGISDGLVLELGCGTGSLTEILADAGYDMIGVDLSADMLDIAMEKREQSGNNILYLLQDMREFELYGTVRAVVSICDSMNYLPCEEDFLQTLKLVNNYLDPEGVFIFDLNTPYKYRELIGDATIAENREDASFIWENTWYEKEQVNEYDLPSSVFPVLHRQPGFLHALFLHILSFLLSWRQRHGSDCPLPSLLQHSLSYLLGSFLSFFPRYNINTFAVRSDRFSGKCIISSHKFHP